MRAIFAPKRPRSLRPGQSLPLKRRLGQNEMIVRAEKHARRHSGLISGLVAYYEFDEDNGLCSECGMWVAPEARSGHPCHWRAT